MILIIPCSHNYRMVGPPNLDPILTSGPGSRYPLALPSRASAALDAPHWSLRQLLQPFHKT